MDTHTVSLVSATVTVDDLGDSTETTSEAVVSGLVWAPEGIAESNRPDAPRVIGEATLYGILPTRLDADALVRHGSACCDGQTFPLGDWQVVGGAKGWGGGRYAVPIRKVSDA